jgi:signal transduction histidine kinase
VLINRARIFTVLALAAVGAVNAAGLWGIAVARRGAAEEAERLFGLETQARARSLESLLSSTRADLAFLAGSAPITRLQVTSGREPPAEAAFKRQAAEASLLLFLRAHPEVTRLAVRGHNGEPLVLTGRRGGVPVLWVSSSPTGSEGAAVAPDHARLTTEVAFGSEAAGPEVGTPIASSSSTTASPRGPGLEAEVGPSLLLSAREKAPSESRRCQLADARGQELAKGGDTSTGSSPDGRRFEAGAEVVAEGWSAPSPWRLACNEPEARAVALVEPVAARYRMTVVFNLAAMALALGLGFFAVREAARRHHLEAQGREEARVRELERQLFHAERLTTVGRLAAGIAHEINNPLEGMANYLTLAKDALDRGDTDAAERRLEGVREGLERAASIVRQVLAHADPAKAPKSSVDLNRILTDTTEFVRSRRDFAAIRFETVLAPDLPAVEGSPIMLGQVAANLIINACEAQPAGGEVFVRSRPESGRVVVEVCDRGPGVGPDDRERIFEPFFSTKSSTGLGLSICHSIARQHGGELAVFPREGGGAVFRMTLPAKGTRTEAA